MAMSLRKETLRKRKNYSESTDSSYSEDEFEPTSKKNSSEFFKLSIQAFVRDVESKPIGKHTLSSIRDKYDFQRRRLYDVIRVFEAIGCCVKTGIDTIIWLGLKNIYPTLLQLAKDNHVFDKEITIDRVLQNDSSISISKLTQNFLLTYFALNENCLDIRAIASFISKNTGRYKSTLCKLYQITYILECIGVVIRKPEVAGFLTIGDGYFVDSSKENHKQKPQASILDINSLLNNPQPLKESDEEDYITLRRNEFHGTPMTQKSAFLNFLENISINQPILVH